MALKVNGILVAGAGVDGVGVPPAGTSAQVLSKRTDVDYDTEWVDLPSIPSTTSELTNDSDFITTADVDTKIQAHRNNTELHITADERELWNSKADKSYVDETVADLVNSAPETLDTLGELAIAFQENETIVAALDVAITAKQDKITGLSNQVIGFNENGETIAKTITYSDIGAAAAEHIHDGADIQSGLDTLATSLTPYLNIGGGAKIAQGSYVGTGTYGSKNPCSITFNFVPKFFIVAQTTSSISAYHDASGSFLIWTGTGGGSFQNVWTLSGTTLKWYHDWYDDAWYQFNRSDTDYYWVAIGE